MKATRTGLMTLLTLAMLAGACSASKVSEVTVAASDAPPPTTAGVPPIESDGTVCASAPTERTETVAMLHDGLERQYDIYVPDSAGPLPLVFGFHAFTKTSADHGFMTGIGDAALERGFIAVLPQGTKPADGRRFFNLATTDDGNLADDLAFTEAILDEVAQQHCVDLTRVYATGWSNGGLFASTLACELGDRIAAVASVSGVVLRDDCPDQPKPIIIFHGTADVYIPYDGAEPGESIRVYGANETQAAMFAAVTLNPVDYIDLWIEHNGCSLEPVSSEEGVGLEVSDYQECSTSGATEVVIADTGGHRWPRYPTDRILDFLFEHRLSEEGSAISTG